MRPGFPQSLLAAWMAAALFGGEALAQTAATNCATVRDAAGNADPKCTTVEPPGASKRFPYPGESSPAATPAASSESSGTPAGPAARRFPYPGEQTAAPNAPGAQSSGPAATQDNGLRDAGSSGESGSSASSSSSSSSSSADQDTKAGAPSGESSSSSSGSGAPQGNSGSPFSDPDPDTTPAPRRGRRKLPPVPRQTPSEREEEDVRVAAFYMNDGNYGAARQRAQDAVALADDDPEAHLLLAESARRLGKLDEAQQHYKRCLELDPVPKLRKAAEKALKEMSGGA